MKQDRIEFETFRAFDNYSISQLKSDKPSVGNFSCSVRKYKVTIELIEEDNSVILQRLQGLWDNTTNHYDGSTLMGEAKKIGYELVGKMGNACKK